MLVFSFVIPAKPVPAKAGSRNPEGDALFFYHSDGSRNPDGEKASRKQESTRYSLLRMHIQT